MENVTFTLPTIGTATMPAADQRELINRQATAVIVSNYLQYLTSWIDRSADFTASTRRVDENELVTIINAVQRALNSSTD